MRDFGDKRSTTWGPARPAPADPALGKRTLTETLPSAPTTHDDPVPPGKASRSSLLSRAEHPVPSGIVQGGVKAGEVEPPAPAMPSGPRPTIDELFGGAQRVAVDEPSLPALRTARGVPFLQLGGPAATALIQQRASGDVAGGEPAAVHEAAHRGMATSATHLPHLEQIQRSFGKHDVSGVKAHVGGDAAASARVMGAQAYATGDAAEVHASARHGLASPAVALPYRDMIQRAFGRHDVSGVAAHVGPEATAAARAMGATAYATDGRVVLGDGADLFTVAHEAAHLVQQRAGVACPDGVSQAGDAHERHANEVAALVVDQRSAEHLLDRYAGGAAPSGPVVQRGNDPTPPPAKSAQDDEEEEEETEKKSAKPPPGPSGYVRWNPPRAARGQRHLVDPSPVHAERKRKRADSDVGERGVNAAEPAASVDAAAGIPARRAGVTARPGRARGDAGRKRKASGDASAPDETAAKRGPTARRARTPAAKRAKQQAAPGRARRAGPEPINPRAGLPLDDASWPARLIADHVYDDRPAITDFADRVPVHQAGPRREAKPVEAPDLARIPPALRFELSEHQRHDIAGLSTEEDFQDALAHYERCEDVIAYQAAMIQHGEYFEEGSRAPLFQALLQRPGHAEGDDHEDAAEPEGFSLPERYKGTDKRAEVRARLCRVDKALAKLGDHGVTDDYGAHRKVQRDGLIAELKRGAPGPVSIYDYANTMFTEYRGVTEEPWSAEPSKKSNDTRHQLLSRVLVAQRALEQPDLLRQPTGPVYRWDAGFTNREIGDVMSPLALYSTSAGPRSSEQLAPAHSPRTLYIIKSHASGRMIQLLAGTKNWYQRETTFPCYAQFIVRGKQVVTADHEVHYVIEELPGGLDQVGDVAGVGLPAGHDGYDLPEGVATATLVDHKHRRLFADGRHPSRKELEDAEVELADDQDVDSLTADNVYGGDVHARWARALADAPRRRAVVTEEQCLAYHAQLMGEPKPYRNHEVGWGTNTYYALAADQRAALTEHGLLSYPVLTGERLDAYQAWVKRSRPQATFSVPSGEQTREAHLAAIAEVKDPKPKGDEAPPPPVFTTTDEMMMRFQRRASPSPDQRYEVTHGVPEPGATARALRELLDKTSVSLEQAVALLAHGLISPEVYRDQIEHHAAALQQGIVAVHPFKDGNGRLSRLMMYKVLQGYSLEGTPLEQVYPVIEEPTLDLLTRKDAWRRRVFGHGDADGAPGPSQPPGSPVFDDGAPGPSEPRRARAPVGGAGGKPSKAGGERRKRRVTRTDTPEKLSSPPPTPGRPDGAGPSTSG